MNNVPSTDHLNKVEAVLDRLRLAKLRVNVKKSSFALYEIEYLGYVLSRDNIKPQPEKVSASLSLWEPQNLEGLCRFLGMVQYYQYVWTLRSHMIAPLTGLVGELGETKVTRSAGTEKKKNGIGPRFTKNHLI